MKRFCVCLMLLCLLFTGCYGMREKAYYEDWRNYIKVTGTLSHIKYSESGDLYLAFENLDCNFDDNNFKIVGENVTTVQQMGIDERLSLGDTVTFVTAPRYFGDGYVMPIVAITVNGEVLLDFETGYANFIKALEFG